MKISSLLTNASIATGLAAVAIISAPSAQAADFTFGFQNILGANDTTGDSIVGQFTFSLEDSGSGKTLWKFNNTGSTDSFVSTIYFDWHGLPTAPLSGVSQINDTGTSAGVNFATSSGKLPQGQNVVTLLSPTLGFDNSTGNQDANLVLAAVSPGSNKDGIDKNQTLAVRFNSTDATTLKDLILADTLRIGIHVQGIAPTGNSDAYFDGSLIPPKAVPVPSFLLGVVAAGALGGSRLLKKKQVA